MIFFCRSLYEFSARSLEGDLVNFDKYKVRAFNRHKFYRTTLGCKYRVQVVDVCNRAVKPRGRLSKF